MRRAFCFSFNPFRERSTREVLFVFNAFGLVSKVKPKAPKTPKAS